jgi:hypothetical protein
MHHTGSQEETPVVVPEDQEEPAQEVYVTPGFKNKTRYTPYVSPGSQISHIATNKGNIK